MSASVTPIAKPKPRARRQIAVAPARGPDLETLDRVLTEMAGQTVTMISRTGSRRAQLEVALKEREAEGEALTARWHLLERHFETARQAYAREASDIAGDIAMIKNALLDGAEQQPERNDA